MLFGLNIFSALSYRFWLKELSQLRIKIAIRCLSFLEKNGSIVLRIFLIFRVCPDTDNMLQQVSKYKKVMAYIASTDHMTTISRRFLRARSYLIITVLSLFLGLYIGLLFLFTVWDRSEWAQKIMRICCGKYFSRNILLGNTLMSCRNIYSVRM